MAKRVDDLKQPKLAPTAGDLGEEAYRANLADNSAAERHGEPAGTMPQWKRPEPRNAPPGQERSGGPEVRLGQDMKSNT